MGKGKFKIFAVTTCLLTMASFCVGSNTELANTLAPARLGNVISNSKKVTLTFNANGGQLSGYSQIQTTDETTFGSLTSVPTATREGGTLSSENNWYYYKETTKTFVTNDTKFTEDTTLFANWQFHRVIFDSGEGKFSDGTVSKTISDQTRIHFDDVPKPVCSNKTFVGWVDESSNPITFPYDPTSNVTLKANYVTGNTITLALMAMDGEFEVNGSAKVAYRTIPLKMTWGELRISGTLPTPKIDGDKMFSSWKLNDNIIDDAYVFTNSTLLTASYEDSISVIFDSNKGTFNNGVKQLQSPMMSRSKSTHTYQDFISATISDDRPIYIEGGYTYNLLGWCLDKDGKGDFIDPNAIVTQTQTFTMYAIYDKDYKLAYNGENYTIPSQPASGKFKQKNNIEINVLANSGYTLTKDCIKVTWDSKERVAGTDYNLESVSDSQMKICVNNAPGFDIQIDINPSKGIYAVNRADVEGVDSIDIGGLVGTSGGRYGDVITFDVNPSKGYDITAVHIKNLSGSETIATIQGKSGSFTMPAQAVVISPVATPKIYNLSYYAQEEGVSAVSFPKTCAYGSSFEVSVTPKTGYRVVFINVEWEGGSDFAHGTPATFDMPASDVVIGVECAVLSYSIEFRNYDDSYLRTVSCKYGETPEYPGSTPTRDSTVEFDYTFTGWEPSIQPATSDAIYKAKYSETKRKYTVTFENYNGEDLASYVLDYGSPVNYGGPTPTRPSSKEYDYVWAGWDKTITAVDGDKIYRAKFTSSRRKYEVKFLSEDGQTVYETKEVAYGEIPEYTGSKTPTKEPTVQYSYVFDGWVGGLKPVTGPASYKAQFTQVAREYHVKFLNWDHSVLQENLLGYNEVPSYYSATPTRIDPEGIYVYTFTGWSPQISGVTGDTEYTAQFSSTANKFLLAFNENGGVIKQNGVTVNYIEVPAGEKLKNYLEDNLVVATHPYGTFKGWSLDGGDTLIDNNTKMPTKTTTITPVWYTYNVTIETSHCSADKTEFNNVFEIYADEIGLHGEDGYAFDHFEYSINGGSYTTLNSMPFRPGALGIGASASIKLKAVYSVPVSNVIVFLDCQGGYFSGYYGTQSISVKPGTNLAEMTLPSPTMFPSGYSGFDCWCLDSAGKNPVPYNHIFNEHTILYAKYVPK